MNNRSGVSNSTDKMMGIGVIGHQASIEKKEIGNLRKIQNKDLEMLVRSLKSEFAANSKSGSKKQLQAAEKGHSETRIAWTQTAPMTESNTQLEKNFLKLKELYETVYKANTALMRDQKDLKEKYSKLLREKGPRTSSRSLPRKELEYDSMKKPPIKVREDSRGKLSSASQQTRSRDTQKQNSFGSSGQNTAAKPKPQTPASAKRPPAPGTAQARQINKKGSKV